MPEPADGLRQDLIDLARIAEPGDQRLGLAVARFGAPRVMSVLRSGRPDDASRSWRLPLEGLRARWQHVCQVEPDAQALQVGARIVARCDAEWPSQLADLGHREPYALWVIGAGSLRLLALRSVSVIGARACTPYGADVARRWSGVLAEAGWAVVSGGASGIDAAAHRGALDAGGVSIAMMPGGVDVMYPRNHDALFARIADSGLLVSEVPPGESVRRQRFLARNRLVAALSRATVVVEAALRSGTTATARFANEINRPVLAVPGSVHSPASAGCHRMIRDHEASIAVDVDDVLDVIDSHRQVPSETMPSAGRSRDALSSGQMRVLDSFPLRRTVSLDFVMSATGLDRREVMIALGLLEVGGWIRREPEGWKVTRQG